MMVTLTYTLESGATLIDSASLDLDAGSRCLVMGPTSCAYRVLGGIIAGVLPIRQNIPWPQIRELLAPFSGSLEIEEGQLPARSTYVGPDPEQHLLLARVSESFELQGIPRERAIESLAAFGLDGSFFNLPFVKLSGGERMRVVLALIFHEECECYVLHGVLPWLDLEGRKCLLRAVNQKQYACVLFLEHETAPLESLIDRAYNLIGNRLVPVNRATPECCPSCPSDNDCGCRCEGEARTTIVFSNVTFFDYPESDRRRTVPIIRNASFSLREGARYCLVGENGSGKSTLAKMICRLITPHHGRILLCDTDLAQYSRRNLTSVVSYVAQFPEQQIVFGDVAQYKNRARREGNAIAHKLLDSYLPDNRPVTRLSPLEKKLLILLSSLTSDTRLVILDEPTWGLSQEDISTLLAILNRVLTETRTLLVITHSREFAKRCEAEQLVLKSGSLLPAGEDRSDAGIAEIPANPVDGVPRRRAEAVSRLVANGLRHSHIATKLIGLFVVAFAATGSLCFIPEGGLPYYFALITILATGLTVALWLVAPEFESRLILSLWVVGTAIYLGFFAIPLTALGVPLTPWMELTTDLGRWLYVLSHPLRMLVILAAGLVFINSVSPLEFRRFGAVGRLAIVLFRAVEYSITSFQDTMDAMLMMGQWPEERAGVFRPKTGFAVIRFGPLLIGTVIRNLLIWAIPWAWIGFSRKLNWTIRFERKEGSKQ